MTNLKNLSSLNVSMGKDEQIIGEYQLTYSILLFFVKNQFYLTNKRFIVSVPNVMLYVIPMGANTATYPLRNIAALVTVSRFKFFRLVIAAMVGFIGLGLLASGSGGGAFFGLLLLVLAALLAIESFFVALKLQAAGGAGVFHRTVFWEKAKAQAIVNDVNQALADV